VAKAGEELVTPGLLETVTTQLLLHGNAFVQILQDAEGRAAALYPLRPERVTIEPDAGGWPAAYLYKAGAATTRIAARDGLGRPGLAHMRAAHPLDDHYGLGCLSAAAGAVAVHNAAARWNKALLDNAARPSGALLYEIDDEAALSDEQFSRLKDELDAQFTGAGNAGRPMLLQNGLKWQPMGLTPADMDFAGLKASAAREIALAFGVPPMLIGLPGDATYANYREANRALWRLTVLPMAARILAGLSTALGAWWPGMKLAVDVDQISALAEDRERLWRQVSAADFLSDAEKRELLGFAAQVKEEGPGA
jgi:HK97 family phage portal protein